MNDNLIKLRNIEISEKQNWLSLIKFYNTQLDKHYNMHSFFYRLRDEAVNKVEGCDIQLQFIEWSIDNGE